VPERRGGAVGVCVRTGGGCAGEDSGAVKFLFAAGPVGGALNAAGPRGGDLEGADATGSYGAGLGGSLKGGAPGAIA
jgi:hypothetical protein